MTHPQQGSFKGGSLLVKGLPPFCKPKALLRPLLVSLLVQVRPSKFYFQILFPKQY